MSEPVLSSEELRTPPIKGIAQALENLSRAGLSCTFEFRDEALARQHAWPADAPLGEEPLRAVVQGLLDEALALSQRAEALLATLPKPPQAERELRVPEGLYSALYGALFSFVSDNFIAEMNSALERLAATPDTLRSSWVQGQLTNTLGSFESRHVLQRLTEWLCETQELEPSP